MKTPITPIRLNPELKAKVVERAKRDYTTISGVIVAALKKYLKN